MAKPSAASPICEIRSLPAKGDGGNGSAGVGKNSSTNGSKEVEGGAIDEMVSAATSCRRQLR